MIRLRFLFLGLLTAAMLLLPLSSLAVDPGQIDPTFNSPNGYALFNSVSPVSASAYDVAVQSDGKILVVGYVMANQIGADSDLLLLRYNSDGSLDGDFGNQGLVIWDSGENDLGRAVALQSDGGIVVVSEWGDSSNYAVRVLRFDTSGSLDSTFGSNGVVSYQPYSYIYPMDLAVGPAGALFVCGSVVRTSDWDVFVLKLTADGSLDSGFGSGGVVYFGDTDDEMGNGLAVDQNGKVAVCGKKGNDFLVLRLTAGGGLDDTFDTDGWLTWGGGYTDYGNSVAIQSDDKIVVAGIWGYFTGVGNGQDGVVARFNADGSLDTATFSAGGTDTTPGYDRININSDDLWDWASEVILLPGGGIQVAGDCNTPDGDYDLFTVRYDDSGNRVSTFDDDGVAVWDDASHHSNSGYALAPVSGGGVVVVGTTENGRPDNDVLAVVYQSNGSLDTAFDTDGVAIYDGDASTADEHRAVAVQPDGKIVVGGYSAGSGSVVLRYTSAGVLDTSFGGGDGIVTFVGQVNALAIQSNGRIVAVGDYNGDVLVARLTDTGLLDSEFSGDGIATYDSGGTFVHGYAVAIHDDMIVVAGTKADKLLVLRFNAGGDLDSGFGSGGVFEWFNTSSLADVAYGVAIQSDHAIVVTGYDENAGATRDVLVARIKADGTGLDATFGTDGFVTYDRDNDGQYFNEAFGLALQTDGRIVVTGYHEHYQSGQTDADLVVIRLTSAGALDSEFGSGGIAEYGNSISDEYGRSVVIQSNGKILVAGWTTADNNADVLAVRFQSNGALDFDFGVNAAYVFAGAAAKDDKAGAIALQPSDGNAVVVGLTFSGAKPLDDGLTLRLETSLKYTLTVTKAGSGAAGGSVTSDTEPDLIWNDTIGSAAHEELSEIILTASGGSGLRFDGWTDCPSPNGDTCTVIMDQARSITAAFTAIHTLTVTKSGTGSGQVSPSSGTLEWLGSVGTEEYDDGTPLTLTASAETGSDFDGWSGDCDSAIANQCLLTVDAAKSVTAAFTIRRYLLTVTTSGTGSGTVTVAPGSLSWDGNSGTFLYDYGTPVSLTAAPTDADSAFIGWTDCPSPNGNSCQASMTSALGIGARFLVNRPYIEVTPAANSFGQVRVGRSSAARTLTVANRGAQVLHLNSWLLRGTEAAQFKVTTGVVSPCTLPLILSADTACTMAAVFSPSATGFKEATVVFFSDDHTASSAGASLSGTGIRLSYPNVTILAPDGGEFLPAGQPFTIRWNSPVPDAVFKLRYSIDNGLSWVTIAKNISGTSYPWTPPAFAGNRSRCLLMIVATKNGLPAGSDQSDTVFTIGVARLTVPNGGEELNRGETYTVAWDVYQTVRPVQRMSVQATFDGLTWGTVADFNYGPYEVGSYSLDWYVKKRTVLTSKARLRVLLEDSSSRRVGADSSDKVFTIRRP